MAESRQKQLLDFLVKESDRWIPARKAADVLGVSTRQVRKYITGINEECTDFTLIESGAKGYRLTGENYFRYKEKVDRRKADTPLTRQNYIMQKLVALPGGYDVFDFADELFVSLPTIENDLRGVRKKLEAFRLTLKRTRDNIRIVGSEKDKRSLMRDMIVPDSYQFTLKDEVQLLTFHYHFWDLRKNILRILVQENDLFTNDYALNNIALHVIVMVERIRNGSVLEGSEYDKRLLENSIQSASARQLADYLSSTYHIRIDETECYHLLVTITNNTTVIDHSVIHLDNIDQYIDPQYIAMGNHVLDKVVRTYYMDPFDDEFKVRFIIHINNLFNRLRNDYLVKNPLTAKIKGTYPLIYDIAVFIAQEFENDYEVHLWEDEIAYIALHIGGYFENSLHNKNKISCVFIYADYYGSYKATVEKVTKLFSDSIHLTHIVSLAQYRPEAYPASLVLSAVDMEIDTRHVIIDPFLTEENIETIRKNVNHILKNQRLHALKAYLYEFIRPGLFYKNLPVPDRREAIERMTGKAIECGFAYETLTENVLQREGLSDTEFNGVAVPHSLREDVITGFLSVAIFDHPLSWGGKPVHMILLIGVNKDSRKVFTEVFDILVEILSEIQNVKELAAAHDYDDFLQKLVLLTHMTADEA